jgi:hypothetical protein
MALATPFYFKIISRSDTVSGGELPRVVGTLARHCPLVDNLTASIAPELAE